MNPYLLKFILRLVILFLIPLAIATGTYSFIKGLLFDPLEPGSTRVEMVNVLPERSFVDVCKELEEKKIVRHWRIVDVLSRLKREDKLIKAGEYELSPSMSPGDILKKLVKGEVVLRKVTVPEGISIWDIGEILSKENVVDKEAFNAAVVDRSLLIRAGINAASFEGYLFPETYFLSRYDTDANTAKRVIFDMLKQGEKQWPSEFSGKASELRMSRHEILTLASIIQKESGLNAEYENISSVFHNRLAKGMKLQSDPTTVYGVKGYEAGDIILKKHLEADSPYNTYKRFGLPPGPICNPGAQAIRAALYPSETDLLYFVADGKGGHVFSKTLDEHNNAVSRYRKGQKKTEELAKLVELAKKEQEAKNKN